MLPHFQRGQNATAYHLGSVRFHQTTNVYYLNGTFWQKKFSKNCIKRRQACRRLEPTAHTGQIIKVGVVSDVRSSSLKSELSWAEQSLADLALYLSIKSSQ